MATDTPKSDNVNIFKPATPPVKSEPSVTGTVDNSPSGGIEQAPIGKVSDALNTENTEKYVPYEESKKGKAQKAEADRRAELTAEEKAEEDKKNQQPITSLAQLRDWHLARGTSPTAEEREKVKKLEEDILAEGAKFVRGPAADTPTK